jgi:hypothetical protein
MRVTSLNAEFAEHAEKSFWVFSAVSAVSAFNELRYFRLLFFFSTYAARSASIIRASTSPAGLP